MRIINNKSKEKNFQYYFYFILFLFYCIFFFWKIIFWHFKLVFSAIRQAFLRSATNNFKSTVQYCRPVNISFDWVKMPKKQNLFLAQNQFIRQFVLMSLKHIKKNNFFLTCFIIALWFTEKKNKKNLSVFIIFFVHRCKLISLLWIFFLDLNFFCGFFFLAKPDI